MQNFDVLTQNEPRRDTANWAQQTTTTLRIGHVPTGALGATVEGKRVAGPLQGFGPLWQKTYRIRLKREDLTPAEIIKVWKANFPQFWPKGNRFYAPVTGIAPGEVALLTLSPGGIRLSTGVLVLYADDESFTLMTSQGHTFAGWITFSAFQVTGEDGIIVQAQVQVRASDPIYELALRFGGHRQENLFWQHTLRALANYFQEEVVVETQVVCMDKTIQWANISNIRHNAGIRTMMHTLGAPWRWIREKTSSPRSARRGAGRTEEEFIS